MEKIQTGKFVQLAYEIFVSNDQGDTSVFKFAKDRPDSFVFGMEQGMLPAFMKNIEGLAIGDKFDFTLEASEAFGDKDPNMIGPISRDKFMIDGKFDDENIFVGARLTMRTEDGYYMDGQVIDLTDEAVILDFNHQLAGERVRYAGEVVTVRDATPEELNPTPHGCGCGCDSCGHGDCGHDHCDCDGCN